MSQKRKRRRYPFGDLKVGGKYRLPVKDRETIARFQIAAAKFAREHDVILITRTLGDGFCRVWRVEP